MSIRLDPEALYVALDRKRRQLRISGAEMLRQAGIRGSRSIWTRLAHGYLPDATNLARLPVWLGDTDLKPYIIEETGIDQ